MACLWCSSRADADADSVLQGVEDHAFMHLAEGAAIGDAVNALLKRHRIEVLTKEGKPALFKAQTADRVTR